MAETAAELGWTAKGPASTSFCYDGGASSSYLTPVSDVVELPLFPLPLVLFPGAILPLQIFEFRYRIMMHTLLETDLRFGVVFSDAGSVAGVGCVGEVVKHERLSTTAFSSSAKARSVRITRLTQTKPYLVAEVSWLEDRPPRSGYPRRRWRTWRISNLFPTPFSFFVGSTFEGAPWEQQALLELQDTDARLRRVRETLRNTLNYC
ncbi:hypothetical protein Taro_027650, partial [Colocasia esculenta]|nr:hypothetical protein [Colocasia esculenta]